MENKWFLPPPHQKILFLCQSYGLSKLGSRMYLQYSREIILLLGFSTNLLETLQAFSRDKLGNNFRPIFDLGFRIFFTWNFEVYRLQFFVKFGGPKILECLTNLVRL